MLEKINFTYCESNEQTDLFTPSHTKFDCTIEYNGKQFTTSYQCNTYRSEPTKEDFLACLISDAEAYDNSEDLADFLCMLEYNRSADEIRKGTVAYKSCKKTAIALRKMFTKKQINDIYFETC